MKILLFAVLALPLAGPAHAMFLGGVEQSFGSDDYKGTKVHAGLNLGAVSITPEYLRYESDRTNGAFHSLGARLSFDTRWVGLGFTVGRVLPHERYSNVSGGADVAVTLSPMGEDGVRRIGGAGRGAAPTGKGVARVDFGGGALATQHKQEAAAAGLGAPSLTQTNAHAFVGASVLNILASARLARNFYDKDLKTAALPASRYQAVAGNMTYEGNYPQNNLLLSVELGALPMVRPFASFAHTTYMDLGAAGQPGDTRAYTAGVRVGLEMVAVEAAIQRLSVNGAKDHTFTTLGASLRL